MDKDLIATSFDEYLAKLNPGNTLAIEAIDILRMTYFSGALFAFSELLPIDKINMLQVELVKFASNPSGLEKAN